MMIYLEYIYLTFYLNIFTGKIEELCQMFFCFVKIMEFFDKRQRMILKNDCIIFYENGQDIVRQEPIF